MALFGNVFMSLKANCSRARRRSLPQPDSINSKPCTDSFLPLLPARPPQPLLGAARDQRRHQGWQRVQTHWVYHLKPKLMKKI